MFQKQQHLMTRLTESQKKQDLTEQEKRLVQSADLGELSAVIVADDSVSDTETMDVSHHALQSVCVCIISHNHARVPH